MLKKEIRAKVENAFKVLPNVKEVWVTEDGNYHLHSGHGGQKVTRAEVEGKDEDVPEQVDPAELEVKEEEEAEKAPETKVKPGKDGKQSKK